MTFAFVAERDAMLKALDPNMIRAYNTKWNSRVAHFLNKSTDTELLAGAHKARLVLSIFSEKDKQISRLWLIAHGYLGEF